MLSNQLTGKRRGNVSWLRINPERLTNKCLTPRLGATSNADLISESLATGTYAGFFWGGVTTDFLGGRRTDDDGGKNSCQLQALLGS